MILGARGGGGKDVSLQRMIRVPTDEGEAHTSYSTAHVVFLVRRVRSSSPYKVSRFQNEILVRP
jgi:hypothetical protein